MDEVRPSFSLTLFPAPYLRRAEERVLSSSTLEFLRRALRRSIRRLLEFFLLTSLLLAGRSISSRGWRIPLWVLAPRRPHNVDFDVFSDLSPSFPMPTLDRDQTHSFLSHKDFAHTSRESAPMLLDAAVFSSPLISPPTLSSRLTVSVDPMRSVSSLFSPPSKSFYGAARASRITFDPLIPRVGLFSEKWPLPSS